MTRWPAHGRWTLAAIAALVALICRFSSSAQDDPLKQQITQVSRTAADNKLALLDYAWQEQETISLKDRIEDQQWFQVEFGPDGKLQRTPLGLSEENSSSSKGNPGMQDWLARRKKRALQAYSHEIKEVAQAYTEFEGDSLRLAYERHDVTTEPVSPDGGARLVVHNYVKTGDSVTLVFDLKSSELQRVEASSYHATASDPVTITALFSRLGDEPNHVDQITVVARKRNLSISLTNLAYHRRSSNASPENLRSKNSLQTATIASL